MSPSAEAAPEIIQNQFRSPAAEGPSRPDLLKAGVLQAGANFLCAIRPFQAADIAKDVVKKEEYRSWLVAGKFAVAVAFDVLDGIMARKAAELRQGETTPTGARLDELADKSLTHIVLGAIATRAGMDGDTRYQSFILKNQKTIVQRDIRVTKKRNEAQALNVEVKAQKSGKKKTRRQNAAIFVMLSPLAKTKAGRFTAKRLQKQSTRLALESEEIYNADFNEGIKRAKAGQSLA
jgi:phosphatidylglycerophosphate synthase